MLYRPVRSLLLFVLVWKLGTELLRPLVGQPNYQFVERAGDYVLPLALFWLAGAVLPAPGADVGTQSPPEPEALPFPPWSSVRQRSCRLSSRHRRPTLSETPAGTGRLFDRFDASP